MRDRANKQRNLTAGRQGCATLYFTLSDCGQRRTFLRVYRLHSASLSRVGRNIGGDHGSDVAGLGQIALMILISLLVPPAALAGRVGVAPLYFALITALSLFLLLQITVSKYDVPTTDIAPTEDSLIISQRR
jgi:hypothetical protein